MREIYYRHTLMSPEIQFKKFNVSTEKHNKVICLMNITIIIIWIFITLYTIIISTLSILNNITLITLA